MWTMSTRHTNSVPKMLKSYAMTTASHHLSLEDILRREYRLFANGVDDLSGGRAKQGDSFEKGVSRASLGDQHEEMLESLNISCNNLSQLFT